MGKLDNVQAALARRAAPKPQPEDMTPYVDQIVGGVLARQTDQAERFRQIVQSLKTMAGDLQKSIQASRTDIRAHVSQAVNGIQFPEFPDIPVPERTDLGPLVQQISALESAIAALSAQIADIPTELPEITLSQAPQVIPDPRPLKWHAKVVRRNQMGGITDVEITAE